MSKTAPIRWEDAPCNLCGTRASTLLFTTRDYRFLTDDTDFHIVRCRGCRLVRMNPRPIEADIHRYYHGGFYRSEESPADALRNMHPRLSSMAKHVNRYPAGRLLDIGCFRGEFMEHVRANHGWDVAGVEFSQTPPNYYGLDIFYGELSKAPFAESSFDVVTMWAVLEHVYDPSAILSAVHRLLKPGGVSIILVPNFTSIPGRFLRHDDVPRHVTMFTKPTLSRMLKRTGLEPIDWSCGQDVCGGSVRGWLNFLVKRMAGEPMASIQAQNRIEGGGRWAEFAEHLNGRKSPLFSRLDRFDDWLAPRLDRVLDTLGTGFIMTVHARKAA